MIQNSGILKIFATFAVTRLGMADFNEKNR